MRRRVALAALVALAAIAAVARPAAAHQATFTYGRLTAGPDGRAVAYELRIRAADLAEAVGAPADTTPDDAALRAGAAAIEAYVAARVDLLAPGQAGCEKRWAPLALEVGHAGRDTFAVLRAALTCPAPIATAALEYDLFFELDPAHVGLVTVDGEVARLTAPDDTRLEWTLADGGPAGLGGFLVSGVEHIAFGLDHLLFLLALLLVAVVRPAAGGASGALEPRPLGAALRYTAGIVTSFTLAHSLTLIAAALGWVALPGRVVESAIALSIVFVAVDNLVRRDPPRRAIVTFAFGLVHGLGFAAMLAPLLPPDGVVAPLLLFNLGVELGQLAAVALALPLLGAAARRLGPARYRRIVVTAGAIGCGGLGAVWFVERAFGITLLGL